MTGVDPFAVLGVDPGSSEQELAAAYRRLAKRLHPDRTGGTGGEARMAELNAAYREAQRHARRAAAGRPREVPVRHRGPVGTWLPDTVRRALGWELLGALDEGERVEVVLRAGRPGRGPVRLAVTDRRLLWLLEDAVGARVDSVRLALVCAVERRRSRLGRAATVRVRTRTGRRLAFGDLEPDVADALAARLGEGR